jgi:hypothetical protein
MTNQPLLDVILVPEIHFAIHTNDGKHTSPNFIIQCRMGNLYKLINPKTGGNILVQVGTQDECGPLAQAHAEVLDTILGGCAHKAVMLGASPELLKLLMP